MGQRAARGTGPRPAALFGWLGLGLHVLVGVFPFSMTGLLAPPWAVAALLLLWAALLVVAWRLRRRRPWWALATPVVALACWWLALTAGDLLLGWTA